MGVMDKINMDSGITMESTPKKGENSIEKGKLRSILRDTRARDEQPFKSSL